MSDSTKTDETCHYNSREQKSAYVIYRNTVQSRFSDTFGLRKNCH